MQADEVFLEIRSRCAYSTDCFVGSCCVESKPRNAMSGADAARRHEDNPSWPRPVLKTPRRSEQQLQDKFQYENVMMIPKFEKIVVNMGVGEAATDSKAIDGAVRDLRAITGQQPMITRARKSIATFRLRAGMPIGCKVTLRGDRMWEFFDRLTSVAIPRIRDFRGISAKSFDGRGNFSMGVTEQLIFPEIDFDSVDHQRGMDITFVTTANTDEEAKALLDAFGFPFKK